jgi:ABC-type transport system involved in multi-copper enzyme maturation permease subunit
MRRNLRSAKGVVMGVLFLLMGAAASLIYAAVSELANPERHGQAVPAEAFREARQEVWTKVWNQEIGGYLADSPSILVALFKATLWFVPFITLVIGFEQVCGDLQHGTFRYDSIRARRASLIVGKAIAIWAVVSTLLLALHGFVWFITLVRGDAAFAAVLSWGPRLWALSAVFAAAYAGWTILMSSLTRRPILSLLIGLIAFSTIWVLDLAADFAKNVGSERFAWMQYVGYALPDFYEAWLVTPKAPEMIAAITILLGMGTATTALSAWIVNRRDV